MPTDDDLRTAGAYPRFLAARWRLLAAAMTEVLNNLRPASLDQLTPEPTDELAGASLELIQYDSAWEQPKLAVRARHNDHQWQAVLSAAAFEAAVAQAATGISTDLDAPGQQLAVRSDNETIAGRPASPPAELDLGLTSSRCLPMSASRGCPE